jgi:hypothetical protein
MQDSPLLKLATFSCRPRKRQGRPRRRKRSASRAAQRAPMILRTHSPPPTPRSAGGRKPAPPLPPSLPTALGPDTTPQMHHPTPGTNTTTGRGGRKKGSRGSPLEERRIGVAGVESRNGRMLVVLHHQCGTGGVGVGVVQTGGTVMHGWRM